MKVRELRELSDEQIMDELEDLKAAMFRLRLQLSSGQLEDTNQIKYTQRDIARCRTILNERRLAADVAEKESANG